MSIVSTTNVLPASSYVPVPTPADGSPFLQLKGLQFNLAESMDQCLDALQSSGLNAFPDPDDGSLWCNATWDTVLCWPATPANSAVTLPCPPLKGLDPTRNITKFCHESGRWMGKTEDDFERAHGWTNFTMCFNYEVLDIMKNLNNGTLSIAQDVAKNARILEFIGLGLSFVSLIFCVFIFTSFRRLRVFRNLLHLHLMIAILCVVLIRLTLYIDLIFTDRMGHVIVNHNEMGKTINTMVIVCETMFFLLEYFKSVAFWWMFLAGLYLHNQLVFAVFDTEPKLWPYLLAGYGIPLVHTAIWLGILVVKKEGKVERCLGSYFLEREFWILNGPRLLQLMLNTFFIGNVIRVLWLKVGDSRSSSEIDRMKKSVKAALMLIPLLGIPNIMQTIPFSPTKENIFYFAIWTYSATLTNMYQGIMIAIIYCFTNREVQTVLKRALHNYKLTHSNSIDLRKSSQNIGASRYSQMRNSSSIGGTGVVKEALVDGSPTNSNHHVTKVSFCENGSLTVIEPNYNNNTLTRINGTVQHSKTDGEQTPLREVFNFGDPEFALINAYDTSDLEFIDDKSPMEKKTSVVKFMDN